MSGHSSELTILLKSLEHPELKSIDLSLERMQRYMAYLGHPERMLPPVVHVAGTNGKGSTIAFVRAILEAAGLHCHVYTSPHLVHFSERVVVAGATMPEEEIVARLHRISSDIKNGYPLTFFEATTAMALQAFCETEADICLLEVGMGGRFDATNVILSPAVTAITPVSMDHQQFLGDSIAAIAYEKAGIIKPDIPCVVSEQTPEAMRIIEEVAREYNAPLYKSEAQISHPTFMDFTPNSSYPEGGGGKKSEKKYISIQNTDKYKENLELSLPGVHQYSNAATAIAIVQLLTKHTLKNAGISEADIHQGLANAQWPARLQQITEGGLIRYLGKNHALFIDGGHNEAAAEAIAEWIKHRDMPVMLVCGMMNNREVKEFLAPLAKCVQAIYAIDIPNEVQGHTCEYICAQACDLGMDAHVALDIFSALDVITSQHINKKITILCCGSLYLAGALLAQNLR